MMGTDNLLRSHNLSNRQLNLLTTIHLKKGCNHQSGRSALGAGYQIARLDSIKKEHLFLSINKLQPYFVSP